MRMESIDKAAAQRVYVRLIEPVRGRIVKNIVIAALSSLCGFVPYFAITRVAQISIVEGVPSLDELAFWVLLAVAGAVAGRILFALATSAPCWWSIWARFRWDGSATTTRLR